MMLLWFIIGTGVIIISVVAILATIYLVGTRWLNRFTGGKDE